MANYTYTDSAMSLNFHHNNIDFVNNPHIVSVRTELNIAEFMHYQFNAE